MSGPFYLVPWQDDFFAALYALIRELEPNPGNALVVFPGQRPRRYLLDYFKQHAPKPALLPAMLTAAQLFARCAADWAEPDRQADLAPRLDRVALLAEVVGKMPDFKLSDLDMRSFFPWGLRLADLLEDMFQNLVEPQDISHAENEVEPFAAALLAGLGHIGRDYQRLLADNKLSTPALEARLVARLAGQGRELPHFLRGRTVILAGFEQLNRAEEVLFHRLWSAGAQVCLHSDPKLATGSGHWSSRDLAALAQKWETGFQILGENKEKAQKRSFYAAYDLHSQLVELRKVLDQDPQSQAGQDNAPDSRVVVLPGPEILLPVLHSLPDKEVNVALGFPLERTLMARFVEELLRAREGALPDGRVHWRSLLHLIRHPYMRMLRVETGPEGEAARAEVSLRPLFQAMEQVVRKGPRLPQPRQVLDQVMDLALSGQLSHPFFKDKSPDELNYFADILEEWLQVMFAGWTRVDSLAAAAEALRECCRFLLRHGGRAWQAFPLDSEAMFRILSQLLPQLENSRLSGENLGQQTVFAILRQMLGDLRVAFEADPLGGLQILGIRETPLLRFKQVIILDLTEDKWPGSPMQDPLLPDNLRLLLDLPSTRAKDRAMAHAFYRLAAGAEDLRLLWQEGQDKSGLLDAKKVRSRFVEDLIWREESRNGALLAPGQPPLRAAAFPLSPPRLPKAAKVARSPEIQARLLEMLGKPLSATWLDGYLTCPLRFYQERLCGLAQLAEVKEGDDPPGLGSVLHEALHAAHLPWLGKEVRQGDIRLDELLDLYRQAFARSDLPGRLPADSLFMLEKSVPLRLEHFLARQPQAYQLLHLEETFSASLSLRDLTAEFQGKMDRVDLRAIGREQGVVILDYKSGRVNAVNPKTWRDDDLWRRLEGWQPDGPDNPLPDLSKRLSSLQLPLYLYIYGQQSGSAPLDAAWVELAGSGLEKYCLGVELGPAERAEILEHKIPLLLTFMLRHLLTSRAFAPQPGGHCEYCPFQGLCPPLSARFMVASQDGDA